MPCAAWRATLAKPESSYTYRPTAGLNRLAAAWCRGVVANDPSTRRGDQDSYALGPQDNRIRPRARDLVDLECRQGASMNCGVCISLRSPMCGGRRGAFRRRERFLVYSMQVGYVGTYSTYSRYTDLTPPTSRPFARNHPESILSRSDATHTEFLWGTPQKDGSGDHFGFPSRSLLRSLSTIAALSATPPSGFLAILNIQKRGLVRVSPWSP